MKTSSKFIIAALLAVLIPAGAFCAEIVEDDVFTPAPQKTAAPSATAAVKPAVTAESIADLKAKLEALGLAVTGLKQDIKSLEEKNIAAENTAKDLLLYKKDLDALEVKYGEDSRKISEVEKSLDAMQDDLKGRMDKMRSWDDILDVLKKQISNNETEMARLKKDINAMKKQYGGANDNIFDAIAQWPYMGFTALIISIAALITVVVVR